MPTGSPLPSFAFGSYSRVIAVFLLIGVPSEASQMGGLDACSVRIDDGRQFANWTTGGRSRIRGCEPGGLGLRMALRLGDLLCLDLERRRGSRSSAGFVSNLEWRWSCQK